MPHSVSARKRVRQNESRQIRNKAVKSSVRTAMKKFRSAVEEGNLDKARADFGPLTKKLDQAAAKGVMHKNTANRCKSRLAALIKQA